MSAYMFSQLRFVVAAAALVIIISMVYLQDKLTYTTLVHDQDKIGTEKVTSYLQTTVTEENNIDIAVTEKESVSGYIVCNVYYGQQGSAIQTLTSLQCWAASFSLPMKIVEPFMEGRVHTMLPRGVDPLTAGKLSDFFDLEHFNRLSRLQGEPTLVAWVDFSKYIPTNVIVLSVDGNCRDNKSNNYADIRQHWTYSSYTVENIEGRQCFSKRYMENNLLRDMDVCVVRIVDLHCLNSSDKNRRMYNDIFHDWDPRNTTLVLKYWRGIYSFQNPDAVDHLNCKDPQRRKMRNKIRTNKKLLSDVQYYKDNFMHTQNSSKVAVMIRAERIFVSNYKNAERDRISVLEDCLEETLEVIHNVSYFQQSQDRVSKGVFLTMDVGKFGSVAKNWLHLIPKDRREETIDKVKNMVNRIYGTQMSFPAWENSFVAASQGVDNPGYIAALQRAIASQADCLVLMGGGNFQLLALYDYLEQHPDKSTQCIYCVCFTEKYNRIFNIEHSPKNTTLLLY